MLLWHRWVTVQSNMPLHLYACNMLSHKRSICDMIDAALFHTSILQFDYWAKGSTITSIKYATLKISCWQMGSEFKSKVLEEQMGKMIKNWHAEVRERRKRQEQSLQSPRISLTEEWRATQINNTFTRVPSFAVPISIPSESIHKSNKGEITEEE